MRLSAPSQVSEYVQLLADTQQMPHAHADRVNQTIIDLVTAYTGHFLRVSGYSHEDEPLSRGVARAKKAGNSDRHKFAVKCLADSAATAALVKEIAFTEVPLNEDGSFESADLGAGTGILSVGAAIAGIRSGASRIILNIVDAEKSMLSDAEAALQGIGNDIECSSLLADITEQRTYDRINPHAVRFWISETISQGTPPMKIVGNRVIWLDIGTQRHDIDPFPEVVDCLINRLPELSELVQGGRARMFPDVFNDHFRPGVTNALRLLTSTSHASHAPLEKVGWDFFRYDKKCSDSRW